MVGLSERDIAAALKGLTKAATSLGLDLNCDPDAYEVSPSGKVTHITIEVYEAGEDSEPVGLMLTDLQTYQWRRVYSKLATGTADQGLAGAKRLLTLVAQEFKAEA